MGSRLEEVSEDGLAENHDINVTPFIDVMLVLLIIFMIAAPLATVSVPVDLPQSNAAPRQIEDEPIYLSVKSDLRLAVGDRDVARTDLKSALDALTKGNTEARIFVRADRNIAYGDLMEVLDELRTARYLKVALVGLENAQPQ